MTLDMLTVGLISVPQGSHSAELPLFSSQDILGWLQASPPEPAAKVGARNAALPGTRPAVTFMEMNQITGMIKHSNFIYFYRFILEVSNCQSLNTKLLKQVGRGKSNAASGQQMKLKGESLTAAGTCLALLDLRHPQQIPQPGQGSGKPLNFRKITPNLF